MSLTFSHMYAPPPDVPHLVRPTQQPPTDPGQLNHIKREKEEVEVGKVDRNGDGPSPTNSTPLLPSSDSPPEKKMRQYNDEEFSFNMGTGKASLAAPSIDANDTVDSDDRKDVAVPITDPLEVDTDLPGSLPDRNSDASPTSNTCALCRMKGLEGQEWIDCDGCHKWLHKECALVDDIDYKIIDKFHCDECRPTLGPSVLKEFRCPHRLLYEKEEEKDKPIQVGSKSWITDFLAWEKDIPEPTTGVKVIDDGFTFQDMFDKKKEWTDVYLIKNKRGLEINTPYESFSVNDCMNILGSNFIVDTIDVYRQSSKMMRLGNFVEKWNAPERPRLYNILSMEFSNTQLINYVHPPALVRELSWVHSFWPDQVPGSESYSQTSFRQMVPPPTVPAKDPNDEQKSPVVNDEDLPKKPEVAMFCLVSMKDSYTDFHIDFGGSSVWYHIFKGKKIFYVAPPTPQNLDIYRQYQKYNLDTHETWLGDALMKAGQLGRVELSEGHTLMIPSGWIHAVLTPEDSLVFGGNFIHSLNISMQLKVYGIEIESNIDDRFKFPQFELCNWYAAKAVTEELKEANEDNIKCPSYLFNGASDMLDHLKAWFDAEQKRIEEEESARTDSSADSQERPLLNRLIQFAPPIIRAFEREVARQKRIRSATTSRRRKQASESPEYGKRTKRSAPKKSPAKPELKIRIKNLPSSVPSTPTSSTPSYSTAVPLSMSPLPSPTRASQPSPETPGARLSIRLNLPTSKPSPSTSLSPAGGGVTSPGAGASGSSVPAMASSSSSGEYIGKSGEKEDRLLAKMFSRRTSSGRTPKPTAAIMHMAGHQIEVERQRVIESGDDVPERRPIEYTAEMERICMAEEKAMLGAGKAPGKIKKKDAAGMAEAISKLSSASSSSGKKAPTLRDKLSKKFNLR